ncbi:MAG: 50S ribosomal protein L15 [Candidatus Saccharimonadales bacterium]
MTKYNELQIGSNRDTKRVGRGISAGQGKTAGRGTKGQKSRSGKKIRPTFAGGSRSMVTAVPKARGFKSLRSATQVVYLDNLNQLKSKVIDNFSLYEAGYIASPYQAVKVILRGEISKPINLQVFSSSKSVQEAIKKAGGTFIKTDVPLKQKTEVKK